MKRSKRDDGRNNPQNLQPKKPKKQPTNRQLRSKKNRLLNKSMKNQKEPPRNRDVESLMLFSLEISRQ